MQQEVPETILVGGKKQVIMLDAKYKPYSRRDVRVENICGSFSNHVEDHRFQGVAKKTRSCFGNHWILVALFNFVMSNGLQQQGPSYIFFISRATSLSTETE